MENYREPLTADFLNANPFLVLDTALFPASFKDALLAEMKDLDENLNGLLIHSENFQALGLMQEKWQKQVKCIYIDPPYNTNNDGFIYKDSYQHSCWLSMMENRLIGARERLSDDGVIFISIDDNEQAGLKNLCDKVFGNENFIEQFIIRSNPRGNQAKRLVASEHEYILCYAKRKFYISPLGFPKLLEEYKKKDEDGYYREIGLRKRGAGAKREDAPNQYYPIFYCPKTGDISVNTTANGIKIIPKLSNGADGRWRWAKKTVEQNKKNLLVRKVRRNGGEEYDIFQKDYFLEDKISKIKSIWYEKDVNVENATEELKNLTNDKVFDYPKPVYTIQYLIQSINEENVLILDYFAGSGTTGHAVVNLNREDGGNRKYIMVEMGSYFDTVTKPRMQKVIYSKDWKEGKPVSRDGISHAFKYIRLESYEDTLNNLSFREDADRDIALQTNNDFRRDYMLKYWLDFETKDSPSLLNIQRFGNPTDYALKVKKPGSDEYEEKTVDIVETFNWLIGLHVDHLDKWRKFSGKFKREPDPELPKDEETRLIIDGQMEESETGRWLFRKVKGRVCRTPGDMNNTDQVLVIWRRLTGNLEEDNLMLDEWFKKYRTSMQANKFNIIYVNGSTNLADLRQDDEHWEVRLIEKTFHQRMWDMKE